MPTSPKPPPGTGKTGRSLWTSVVGEFELDEHELSLLRQAVGTVELIDALDAEVAEHGVVIESPQGRKTNPAVAEVRQQRIALARLLAALRLPSGESGDEQASARPQRRAGVRGTYGIRGAVS